MASFMHDVASIIRGSFQRTSSGVSMQFVRYPESRSVRSWEVSYIITYKPKLVYHTHAMAWCHEGPPYQTNLHSLSQQMSVDAAAWNDCEMHDITIVADLLLLYNMISHVNFHLECVLVFVASACTSKPH